jgi:hypothetical protein
MSDTTRRRGREERAARNQVRRAANRLILLSVVLVVGLCALGLWVTKSSGGPETRAGSFWGM